MFEKYTLLIYRPSKKYEYVKNIITSVLNILKAKTFILFLVGKYLLFDWKFLLNTPGLPNAFMSAIR